jgi:hypothetical protein
MVVELLTGALVVITAFYAWATFKILRANERVVEAMHTQAIAGARPYVVVAPLLEVDNPIFYLRISNLGRSAATNLRLSIDKSFFMFGENRDLSELTVFNKTIDSFPPGAEITFALAQGFKVFEGDAENPKLPHTFSVSAAYEFADRKVQEINRIDLRPYLGAGIPQDAYVRKLKEISESLKTVARHVEKSR